MTDKPDTSAAALRNKAIEHDNFGYNVTANLLRAIADEKESWTAREAELVRERDEARTEAASASKKADEEMERVKACEHIAEGDEGWEVLTQICPSTAAVAALRLSAEQANADAAAIREAWTTVNKCLGIDVRCEGDEAARAWNRFLATIDDTTAGRDLLARVERMRHALVLLLDEADCFDNRPLEPHCQECTKGQTPAEFDQGLCAYHIAKAALADKEPPA